MESSCLGSGGSGRSSQSSAFKEEQKESAPGEEGDGIKGHFSLKGQHRQRPEAVTASAVFWNGENSSVAGVCPLLPSAQYLAFVSNPCWPPGLESLVRTAGPE